MNYDLPCYIDTKFIADDLEVSREYVSKTVVRRPDFPAPKFALSQKLRKWTRDDYYAWKRTMTRKAAGA